MAATDALSYEDVNALARAFPDPPIVRKLLSDAGFPLEKIPSWNVSSPLEMWRAVSDLLGRGVLLDGRSAVLAAAAAEFPFNPAFNGKIAANARRLTPSWDDLRAARPLPEQHVRRASDIVALSGMLNADGAGAVGVVGIGGAGKSTLVRDVLYDDDIRDRFDGGAVWVEVNPDADVTAIQARVLRAFGDARTVTEVADGRDRLRELLAGARCLIVLDDVWEADVLAGFPRIAGARLLVTTRSREVLQTGIPLHHVGPVDAMLARTMLAAYADWPMDALPDAAEIVLRRCGGLALALAVAGGLVSDLWEWDEVAQRLEEADLGALRVRFPDYPDAGLLAVVDTTVRLLAAPTAARLSELAVFKGRGPVPLSVVERLWEASAGIDRSDTRQTLRSLANVSLIQIDLRKREIAVHDLVFDYARAGLTEVQLVDLHRQLSFQILDRWGGLDQGLARLRDLDAPTDLDLYGIAELVGHLLAASRPDLVDSLLANEWPDSDGTVHNAWFAVHENLGDTADYLAAVRAAWHDARSRQQTGDPRGLTRQINYALLTGSITSRAAKVPPALLTRLVESGQWQASRALAYARSTPRPEPRARALAGLASHLPSDRQHAIMREALGAVAAINDSTIRAQALATLARAEALSDDLVRQMLSLAIAIASPPDRAQALRRLAPFLPADQVSRAFAAATAISGVPDRSATVAALASRLPDELLEEAFATATAIVHPAHRTEVIVALAPRLPDDLLRRGLADAYAVSDPAIRGWALAALAPHLPEDQSRSAWANALAASSRAGASGYWWWLFSAERELSDDVLEEALIVVTDIAEPPIRAQVLCALIGCLPAGRRGSALSAALATTAAIRSPFARAYALSLLAPHLPEDKLHSELAVALAAIATLPFPADRASAISNLAPHLPAAMLREAVTDLPVAIAALDGRNSFSRWLARLAGHLPVDLLEQAVSAASDLATPFIRRCVLEDLAPHLPADLFGPALSAAAAIDEGYWRQSAIAVLAPYLPDHLLGQALAAATVTDSRSTRAQAVARLARYLAENDEARRTQSGSVGNVSPSTRKEPPDDTASLTPDNQRGPELQENLAAARAIVGLPARTQALARLVRHLPDGQRLPVLAEALVAARAISSPSARSRALARLVPYLPDGQRLRVLSEALAAARAIVGPSKRAAALSKLAPLLPDEQVGQTLGEALEAAAAVGRSRVLGVLPAILACSADPNVDMARSELLRVQRWWP